MRNSISRYEDYALLELFNGEKVKIDIADIEMLSEYKWTKAKVGYAVAQTKDGNIYMHRYLLSLNKGDKRLVDHVNGDGLDNRRRNLRICTKTQNQQNQRPRHTGRSKYKGVGYYVRDKKWRARVKNSAGRDIELGKFSCEMCAAIAYDEAAKNYHGEFAWLNRDHFPEINDNLHPLRDVDFQHGDQKRIS